MKNALKLTAKRRLNFSFNTLLNKKLNIIYNKINDLEKTRELLIREYAMKLKERVLIELKKQERPQSWLARKIGLNHPNLRELFLVNKIDFKEPKIARVLGVDFEYLVGNRRSLQIKNLSEL
jgi:hypothetical protein